MFLWARRDLAHNLALLLALLLVISLRFEYHIALHSSE